MSITQWFKNLFSGGSDNEASLEMTDHEVDINEARLDAGGSGIMGVAQHDSPGEDVGRHEAGDY